MPDHDLRIRRITVLDDNFDDDPDDPIRFVVQFTRVCTEATGVIHHKHEIVCAERDLMSIDAFRKLLWSELRLAVRHYGDLRGVDTAAAWARSLIGGFVWAMADLVDPKSA